MPGCVHLAGAPGAQWRCGWTFAPPPAPALDGHQADRDQGLMLSRNSAPQLQPATCSSTLRPAAGGQPAADQCATLAHLCCLGALPLRRRTGILRPVDALLNACGSTQRAQTQHGLKQSGSAITASGMAPASGTAATPAACQASWQTGHPAACTQARAAAAATTSNNNAPASTPFAVCSHSPSAADTEDSWSGRTSRQNASSTYRHLLAHRTQRTERVSCSTSHGKSCCCWDAAEHARHTKGRIMSNQRPCLVSAAMSRCAPARPHTASPTCTCHRDTPQHTTTTPAAVCRTCPAVAPTGWAALPRPTCCAGPACP